MTSLAVLGLGAEPRTNWFTPRDACSNVLDLRVYRQLERLIGGAAATGHQDARRVRRCVRQHDGGLRGKELSFSVVLREECVGVLA